MIKTKFIIIIIAVQLLTQIQEIKAQEKDSIAVDTNMELYGVINYLDINSPKWVNIGAQDDLINNVYGFSISNGFDERPLFHFEDMPEDLLFKILGNTDLGKSYSFAADLAFQYPIKRISMFSAGYRQLKYPQNKLFERDIYLSAMSYLNKIDLELILNIGYKDLNDSKNVGAELGIQKVLIYQKLYSKAVFGYYKDYWIYSGFIEGFIYRHTVGLKLSYNRIDTYDFLTLGFSLTLNRRK